ncbi:MAG: hypothetical protein WC860_04685 [Candidatus Margulisiibacteriota bacterium]|jgi:hypothetical protein
MDKRKFKKGQLLFHKDTKEKIMFGSWTNENQACCLDAKKNFIYLEADILETDYISYSSLEKKAREQRRGQTW